MNPIINVRYYEGCLVEINCSKKLKYRIIIKDDNIIYFDEITNNRYNYLYKTYFIDYQIEVFLENELIFKEKINLTDKYVKITCSASALGDNIAFIGQIDKFQKKHNCKIYFDTCGWSELFKEMYPNIKFEFNRPDKKCGLTCGLPIIGNICDCWYATYLVGYNFDWENKSPVSPRLISLIKVASDQLGLEYEEIKPKINIENKINLYNKKYICIAIQSTAKSKYWNYENGWEIICQYLNKRGYDVLCIDKNSKGCEVPTSAIDKTGDISIQERITDILNCEFFIGLGSGLSWLAWALNKDVIMISGFSNPISEFKNNYRIFNPDVCNSCWNDPNFKFEDWGYCMRDKDFECSKKIIPEMIIEKINLICGMFIF